MHGIGVVYTGGGVKVQSRRRFPQLVRFKVEHQQSFRRKSDFICPFIYVLHSWFEFRALKFTAEYLYFDCLHIWKKGTGHCI